MLMHDDTGSDARIARDIAEFDAQGWHRTATDVDAASGAWLRERLAEAGIDARLETYPFSRLVPRDCRLMTGDYDVAGLPLFDAPATPAEGVRGRLGLPGDDCDICVVTVRPGGPSPELERLRREGSHRAIVAITTGGRPGLAPRNAEAFRAPHGKPTLQVSSEHGDALDQLARDHAAVHLVSYSTFEETTATNVIGEVPGTDAGLPPAVVMTPRSGWWNCASERGGGIACWLEVARAIAASRLRRTVLFLASTGHELGYWGLEEFLKRRPGIEQAATPWLHLGASVGATLDPTPHLFASNDALEQLAVDALAAANAPMPVVASRGTRPGGESRNIHDAGGDYISLAGGSAVFHLEADRWPTAVSAGTVARYAEACSEIIRRSCG
jgi:hypothetical protein